MCQAGTTLVGPAIRSFKLNKEQTAMLKFLTSASIASLLAVSAASAQTADPPRTQPQTPPAATTPAPSSPSASDSKSMDRPAGSMAGSTADSTAGSSSLKLTDAEAKEWVGKTVYSSDDKNLGEVAAFQRGAEGKVQEMHADIGGFLGIGESRVRVLPSEFTLAGDRIVLKMTGEQAKALPKIEK